MIADSLKPFITTLFSLIKTITYAQITHYLPLPISTLLFSFNPPSMNSNSAASFGYCYERARSRIAEGATDRADFMSYILKHNDEKGMTKAEIESNSVSLIIAGSETTATLLSGLTYQLLKTPDKMARLTSLIRTTFASEKDITIVSVTQLEYFTACLEEALRMYPPLATSIPRHTLPDGNMICNEFVPGNTTVSVLHYPAYSSSKNFADPKMFVPERWLKEGKRPERYDGDRRDILRPFSFGPRGCIGRKWVFFFSLHLGFL